MVKSSKNNTYKLVNPYIKGEFKRNIETPNSMKAAKVFYENLSEHFNNSIPKFYFTIQKGGSNKYYHFEVKEKKNKSEVSYSIRPYEIKGETNINSFVENFKSFKSRYNNGIGGAKKSKKSKKSKRSKKSSESESDSDSDDYYLRDEYSYVPSVSQPIYYMYYDPHVYNLDSFFLPTFYAYATPIIELNSSVGLIITP